MLIKLNQKFEDLKGENFYTVDQATQKKIDMTFRSALIVSSLSTDHQESDGVKKFKAYELAKRITQAENDVEVTAEDIALIKKNGAKAFGTEAYGTMCELLEGCAHQTNVKKIKG